MRAAMSVVAGYTICFTAGGRLRQITIAELDDKKIERMLHKRFGEVHILSRMAIDAKVLDLLRLRRGEWLEWIATAP